MDPLKQGNNKSILLKPESRKQSYLQTTWPALSIVGQYQILSQTREEVPSSSFFLLGFLMVSVMAPNVNHCGLLVCFLLGWVHLLSLVLSKPPKKDSKFMQKAYCNVCRTISEKLEEEEGLCSSSPGTDFSVVLNTIKCLLSWNYNL